MDVRFYFVSVPLILGLIAFGLICLNRKEEKKGRQLEKKKQRQEAALLDLQTSKLEIRELVEEIKRKLDDASELELLSKAWDRVEKKFKSGNSTMDSILTYKEKICASNGIHLECEIGKVPNNILSENEMISLIGNLLDNAIEASLKSKERWIVVKSEIIKNIWIFRIKNSKTTEESPIKQDMRTTKADKKNHGLGVKIVKKIIKRKKGYIKMSDKGAAFEVFIGLPIKEED